MPRAISEVREDTELVIANEKEVSIDETEIDEPEAEVNYPSDRYSDPSIKTYLHEAARAPLLTRAEEVALGKRIEKGQIELKRALAVIPSVKKKRIKEIVENLLSRPALWDELMSELEDTKIAIGVSSKKRKKLLADVKYKYEEVRKIKQEFMEANLRLVVSRAKHYTGSGMSLLDFIQEGNIGLMRVVDKYDYRRGFKFSTYATWWINQAITRAIADQSRTIRIPVHMVETINSLSRVRRQMTNELGREPQAEELAERSKISLKKVRMIEEISRAPLSLETPALPDSESSLGEFLGDEDTVDPDTELRREDLKEEIRRALDTLSPKEREILRLRFGFDGGDERTLEQIGQHFSLTRERIRQIQVKALRKLRHPWRGKRLRKLLEA